MNAKHAVSAGAVLVWAAATFFGSIFGSFAQTQDTSSGSSPPDGQDSVVQVVADSHGLPLVPFDQLPRAGTWWVVGTNGLVPVPYPCPPNDPNAVFYALGPDGVFLADASGGTVPQPTGRQAMLGVSTSTLVQAQADSLLNLIVQQQTVQINAMMSASSAMSPMDAPFPGGGGDGGGTNTYFGSNFTPVNYGTNLWIRNDGMASGNVVGIVSNSTADVLYEIQSLTNLSQNNWNSEGFISGSELTNWTALSVGANGRAQLYLRIRSWADSTGTGIPDWWWLQFFGQITNVDAYAPDPAGDGYDNLQKFTMGLNPFAFITPPTPTGLYAYTDSTGTNVLISWNPSPGLVQHYTLGRYVYNPQTFQWVYTSLGQVSANATSFQDTITGGSDTLYQLSAVYPGGSSPVANAYLSSSPPSPPTYNYNIRISAYLVRNQTGHWQLIFSAIPTNVQAIAFYWYVYDYYYGGPSPDTTVYQNGPLTAENDIPISSISNGVYVLPDFLTTNWFPNNWIGKVAMVQAIGPNNKYGSLCQAGFQSYDSPVFVDGRQHLKQNLLYELRAATISQPNAPLSENNIWFNPYFYSFGVPVDTNYVESSIFHSSLQFNAYTSGAVSYMKMDNIWPFTANYELHQNLYNPNFSGPSFVWQPSAGSLYGGPDLSFQGTLATIPAPAVLGIGDPYWTAQSLGNLADLASYTNNGNLYLQSGAHNLFGLAFTDALVNQGNPIITVAPGNSVGWANVSCFSSQTADPSLQLVSYYFAPVNTPGTALPLFTSTFQSYPLPSYMGFASTNQTGLLVASVGTPTVIGGWAKFSVQNGNPNKFAYLGQYFVTNAFIVTNGVVTTNTTGVVSPYGDFFPTQAGQVAMMTMPDIDTGQQGTGIVRVISLNADGNHDGVLDFSYAGSDQTSPSRPFRFWANDNQDAFDDYGTGIPGVQPSYLQDGYAAAGDYYVPNPASGFNWQPFYRVHGRRDLVDFFPVYLNIGSLFQSNALSAGISITDTNYQFVLSQADGVLRFVYTDLTPTNYMNYLRDTNESGSLVDAVAWPVNNINYNPIALSQSFIAGIATNNQGIILVEAATNTTQPLVLTIYHGTNQIAQTQLYLSISGVEQMFRQKSLLLYSDPGQQPDRLTDASVPNEPDTADKNFVFLHGYNVNPQQARGVASDMFKRMYWSGSHAKFYSVVWSGYDSQWFNAVTVNYHTNEVHACATAPSFASFLTTLTNGPTTVAAHSLGNMVVLSAMNDYNVQSISTYFMIDAAIPLEAIQGNATPDSYLYYPDWEAYADKLNASHWGQLWPTNDARSALTWKNRFLNLQNTAVYDFYSSGEEVLREYTNGAPPGELLGSLQQAANYIENELFNIGQPAGSYVWAWQELLKGRGGSDGVIGSTHGGWKFNTNAPYAYVTNGVITQIPNSQATLIPNSQLQTNAFFDVTSPGFGNTDLALFGSSGSSYAQTNQNRILSDAIPALTLPAGANPISIIGASHNFDMQGQLENGWPAGRPRLQFGQPAAGEWHHSDFHQVAYTFTHQLFDNIVTLGGLK